MQAGVINKRSPGDAKIVTILTMVKFSHTIFALPMALMSALLAVSGGWPSAEKLILIVLAMIGARNGAMAFNRLADEKFDAANPRTKDRALPQGKLTRQQIWWFVIFCSLLFFAAAYFLGRLAFYLSPLALAIIFFYSYTKRFTHYAHIVLGISLGLAPMGAWIGIRDSLDLIPLLLGITVIFWVAGFDIIYACQDTEFDTRAGLHSVPQYFGVRRALIISAVFHLITLGLLYWIKTLAGLGIFYSLAWMSVAGLLTYEHCLVKPNDLKHVNQAFAIVNGMVSVVLFFGTLLDRFYG
ncbi:MAG: UbiA family prenyltransferase [Candidatus Schekmanbacteria bacterium]|nr:UbiA family prenyltransferase [Candidatus Schekmanbacteria bacterium]